MLTMLALIAGAVIAAPATASSADGDPTSLARAALRSDLTDEVLYFVLPDRFENGDVSNDEGGVGGTSLDHGHDPANKGFYHGGDLAGLLAKMDYLQGLGVTAIWMAPIFKNRPVQFDGRTHSAGYHGYWITDFTQVDPHFGTNDELRALVDEAHARGMKVIFDIITNHTADVIDYDVPAALASNVSQPNLGRAVNEVATRALGRFPYRSKTDFPYRDAQGNPFDDRDYAGTDDFPQLDPETSFPFRPVFRTAGDATVKAPEWLNDVTLYHNRGDSAFAGENSLYGDFVGLDDLFTEHPRVVQGMIDIHKWWISEFGIDGFRIDTVKHVNMEFWQAFAPAILEHAAAHGKDEFFMFGEVFDGDPRYLSTFTTTGRLPAVLDFGFFFRASEYVTSPVGSASLAELFVDDDFYTDADSNAHGLATFLGNHDAGRIGRLIQTRNRPAGDDAWVARSVLGHALMYFARGNPVVYYGDEQGFTGDGGDQDARHDLFPSRVVTYNDDDLIGTDATTADANFDTEHPLYKALADLATVRREHRALRQGAQLQRFSSSSAGVLAFSRIDRDEQVEFVVAVNNATAAATASFRTDTPDAAFTAVYPADAEAVLSDAAGTVDVTVPPLGVRVWRADRALPQSEAAPAISLAAPAAGAGVNGRVEVRAELDVDRFASVTFAVQVGGGEPQVVGTDDNRPYRVFYDTAGLPDGTPVRFTAVVDDHDGHLGWTATQAVVGPTTCTPGQPGFAVFHYQRPSADYDGWGLYLWEHIDDSERTTWPDNRPFTFTDAYGRWACVRLAPGATRVGFIVQRAGVKDVDQDRFIDPRVTPEVWLRQGDPTIHTEPPG